MNTTVKQIGGMMSTTRIEILTDMKKAMTEHSNELIIEAINNSKTREEVVGIYTDLIPMLNIDWQTVNKTITEKWSISGLKYIKEHAWG